MQMHRFDDGDAMPLLGLGTWKSGPGEVQDAVAEALQIGYRHIDCAPVYGNEHEVGIALTDALEAGVVARNELWVTSKLWNDSHAPDDVRPAIEKTLADLRLGYIDLYLIHWPVAQRKGVGFPEHADDMVDLDELPIAETWPAMEELVDDGIVRHIGVSNFSAKKLDALRATAHRKPEMNQVELHPYLQQQELLDYCSAHHIGLTAYSPLGSPDRPAGLKASDGPPVLDDPVIGAIAQRLGVAPAQVLIRWAIQRGTAVIPKSVNPERLAQNFAAAEIELTEEDMSQIAALDQHRRYITGTFWALEGSSYSVATLWDE